MENVRTIGKHWDEEQFLFSSVRFGKAYMFNSK